MSTLRFARDTFLRGSSAACLWRHPIAASRIAGFAAANLARPVLELALPGLLHECPVCGWRGRRLEHYLSGDEIVRHCICPRCGSFDRDRHLALALKRQLASATFLGGGGRPLTVVSLSSSKAMRRVLRDLDHADVLHCSFEPAPHHGRADLICDLRQMALRDGVADLVLCSHVLEHIADLDSCLTEMIRILKPGGSAWIQVPYAPGQAWSRSLAGRTPRSHGHAWLFGRDFRRLLGRPGWDVVEHRAWTSLPGPVLRRFAIHPLETYWVARRRSAAVAGADAPSDRATGGATP
jgi:SAM-dependent methyltransferase